MSNATALFTIDTRLGHVTGVTSDLDNDAQSDTDSIRVHVAPALCSHPQHIVTVSSLRNFAEPGQSADWDRIPWRERLAGTHAYIAAVEDDYLDADFGSKYDSIDEAIDAALRVTCEFDETDTDNLNDESE